MRFVLKWILSALVIYLLSRYLDFVRITDITSLLVFMLLLALLNVSVKPLLIILTIPVTLLTLGLFLIIINGLMVLLADFFISGIHIGQGLWGAIIYSILIAACHFIIDLVIGD